LFVLQLTKNKLVNSPHYQLLHVIDSSTNCLLHKIPLLQFISIKDDSGTTSALWCTPISPKFIDLTHKVIGMRGEILHRGDIV